MDFFNPTERTLLGALQNPKFTIAGVRRADLSPLLEQLSPSALSRQIRRLRCLGLIKRAARTYRYCLTRAGRAVIAAASHITEIRHRSCTRLTKSVRKVTRLGW